MSNPNEPPGGLPPGVKVKHWGRMKPPSAAIGSRPGSRLRPFGMPDTPYDPRTGKFMPLVTPGQENAEEEAVINNYLESHLGDEINNYLTAHLSTAIETYLNENLAVLIEQYLAEVLGDTIEAYLTLHLGDLIDAYLEENLETAIETYLTANLATSIGAYFAGLTGYDDEAIQAFMNTTGVLDWVTVEECDS